jgi:methionyl aminopeptidase
MKAIRPDSEVNAIRESCEIAAMVLRELELVVAEGINTYDIDQIGKEKIASYGAKSACFNYRHGAQIFPAHTCISVNEEIVHGIGRLDKVLNSGDIISLDVCVEYNGFIGDNAKTVAVGVIKPKSDSPQGFWNRTGICRSWCWEDNARVATNTQFWKPGNGICFKARNGFSD